MTNVEWLRSLSDEQLLDFLWEYLGECMVDNSSPHCSDKKRCYYCWQQWLETKRTEET